MPDRCKVQPLGLRKLLRTAPARREVVQHDFLNLELLLRVELLNELPDETGTAVTVVFVQARVALVRERALAEERAALVGFFVDKPRNGSLRRVKVEYDEEGPFGELEQVPDRWDRVLYRKCGNLHVEALHWHFLQLSPRPRLSQADVFKVELYLANRGAQLLGFVPRQLEYRCDVLQKPLWSDDLEVCEEALAAHVAQQGDEPAGVVRVHVGDHD